MLLFLDACCLINLFASRRIEDILGHLRHRCATSRLVTEREMLAVWRDCAPGSEPERELVSTSPLESSGKLLVLDLESPQEKEEFVGFAADLDDGEASVCALAVVRGGAVATDDRKALRILRERAPQVPTFQTPSILFKWAQRSGASEVEISAALREIRDRGNFFPPRDSPHFGWWSSLVQAKEQRR